MIWWWYVCLYFYHHEYHTWQALTSNDCPSLVVSGSALLTCCQRCHPPCEDTHHYHHCIPLPLSLSVSLALSLAACCPLLMKQQSHCWLKVQANKSWWHCSGSILLIRKLRNTQSGLLKTEREKKKKLVEDKPLFLAKIHKQSGYDLKMKHFPERDIRSLRKTIGADGIADALFPWVVLHHHDE